MSLISVLLAALCSFVVGEAVARLRGSLSVAASAGLMLAVAAASVVGEIRGIIVPFIGLAPSLMSLLGLAAILARPPNWRASRELGRLTETTLLLVLCFSCQDLRAVGVLWLLSLIPGLRHREQEGVSRRPFVLVAIASVLLVGGALVGNSMAEGKLSTGLYIALVLGGALRMGVPPFSPLVMASTKRLSLGRTALVAACRPSVALLLAVRLSFPEQVEPCAVWLQPWAACAALLAGLQGLSSITLRRSLGVMAATQSSIILYGLVSPGEAGVFGAMVQWAGLGLSLFGLGLLVEAVESRVGHRRAPRVRGLIGPAPGMALLFLLFASTLSGFPGTTGFVGEDLVMQAPAHPAPLWRGLLLAATALNGITMLRLFAHSFLGPVFPKQARGFPPMNGRERLVLGTLALALGALTAWPGVLEVG